MDVRELKQFLGSAAAGSLILLGSSGVLAGNRPHEQPTRPHMSAACSPNWGFSQTCWSRFPAVPDCPGNGFGTGPETYGTPSQQQMIYMPQSSLYLPNLQLVAPQSEGIQSPISVFPNSLPAATGGSMNGMPAMPPLSIAPPAPEIQPQVLPGQPLNGPMTPNLRVFPPSSGPGGSNVLPPLPAPPASATNQSNLHRSYRSSGLEQPTMGFSHSSAVNNGQITSRYGNSWPSAGLAHPSSLTSALVANSQSMSFSEPQRRSVQSVVLGSAGSRYGLASQTQQMPSAGQIPAANLAVPGSTHIPMTQASQSRAIPNQSKPSSSYRSAAAMPGVPAASRSPFVPTQLIPMQNCLTIPPESLRSTP